MFDSQMLTLMWRELLNTLYMTVLSALGAYALGLPLGLFLVASGAGGVRPMPRANKVLGAVINLFRSVPFIILLLTLMPVTRFIVGTTIGTAATIVPLFIAAAPFVARMVESSAKEVDRGVVEAAQSMGASPLRIVLRVILPESLPSLITGAATVTITILGYSTMAGFVGGGGLGAVAINYGYQRGDTKVMLCMVVVLVIVVQVFQEIGSRLTRRLDKRIR